MSKVFIKHGSYHIDLGRDDKGKRRSKKLSRLADGESALFAALAQVTRPKATTVSDLLDSFMIHGLKELAPTTQESYRGYIERQLKPVFGEMSPDDIEPVHVAQYLERRKEKAHVGANKEMGCLASAFQYGMRNGLCNGNPCRGVRRNRTRPKDRYVRHEEFRKSFDASSDHVQDLMAGIYLMGLRPTEARELRRQQITPEGVRFQESKTGKVRLIEWSPALQFFLTRATSRFPESPFVFTNSQGDKWTKWAMASVLRRMRRQVGGDSWTWHDLRAKAESDHKEGLGLLPLYNRAKRVRPVR
jgi:site-specific recombinase XerD